MTREAIDAIAADLAGQQHLEVRAWITPHAPDDQLFIVDPWQIPTARPPDRILTTATPHGYRGPRLLHVIASPVVADRLELHVQRLALQ